MQKITKKLHPQKHKTYEGAKTTLSCFGLLIFLYKAFPRDIYRDALCNHIVYVAQQRKFRQILSALFQCLDDNLRYCDGFKRYAF